MKGIVERFQRSDIVEDQRVEKYSVCSRENFDLGLESTIEKYKTSIRRL